MYYWNSPALAQMASKTCYILNKKESALQWMQYENKTWFLWVRYCSFSSRYCPQWVTHTDRVRKIWPWVAGTEGKAVSRISFGGFSFCDAQLQVSLWMAQEMSKIPKFPGLSRCKGQPSALAGWSFPQHAGFLQWRGAPDWCYTGASRDVRRRSVAGQALFPYKWTCHPIKTPILFSQTQALGR